ncbi:hypothetical protein PCASD_09834 [Puccinia coronata f. sp. avenae]|uniref:Uncharacterized protein n=1 Tax=Puccinia coronata f. sp. avenae TaxID=200324 RepID=A0A2N5UM57_9BASI|nr:hypothetical protein PCASD_09834 [Puccinia coronata f. sp. avenae]
MIDVHHISIPVVLLKKRALTELCFDSLPLFVITRAVSKIRYLSSASRSDGQMAEWSKALVLGSPEDQITSLRAWGQIPLCSSFDTKLFSCVFS